MSCKTHIVSSGSTSMAALTGTVFADANRDNVRQAGEPGLGGVQVSLYQSGDTAPLKQTVTQSDGSYRFTSLTAGPYRVAQTRLGEYAFSDTGVLTITLSDFSTVAGVDFGNYDAARVAGYVWNDGDQDGQRQTGEPGIISVTVSAFDQNNQR